MKFAKQAWNFLYSEIKEHRDDRWFVCMLAGIDPEALEARMAVAAIPMPTYDTLRNAWTQLELAYWRLNGKVGPEPVPRPANSKPANRAGANGRVAMGHRVNTHGRDRRDAGQPFVPRRSSTLLFGRGVPANAKFANTIMSGVGGSARQFKFRF